MKTFTLAKQGLAYLSIAAVISGCANRSPETVEAPRATVKAPVTEITVSAVPETYVVAGTVNSRTRVQISSKILGRITNICCSEGDHVAKGQTVVEVDNHDAAARLEAARADLDEAHHELDESVREEKAAFYAKSAAQADLTLAEQGYKRYSDLIQSQAVSQQEFDNANAKYQSALAAVEQAQQSIAARAAHRQRALAHIARSEANVKEAQVQLGYSRITSPVSGVVAAKQVNIGDMAMAGATLLSIDAQNYRLEAPVDESRMSFIQRGETVPVSIDGLGPMTLMSRVDEIVPAADPATRSFTVKLALPEESGLRSGLFGRAQFALGTRQAIEVPVSALIRQGQLTMIYVVDAQGIARLRMVKTGQVYGDKVEILSGLTAGENAVLASTQGLHDGVRVVQM